MIDSEKVIIPGSPPGFRQVAVCDACKKRQPMFDGLPEGWHRLGSPTVGKYHFCSAGCKYAFIRQFNNAMHDMPADCHRQAYNLTPPEGRRLP